MAAAKSGKPFPSIRVMTVLIFAMVAVIFTVSTPGLILTGVVAGVMQVASNANPGLIAPLSMATVFVGAFLLFGAGAWFLLWRRLS